MISQSNHLMIIKLKKMLYVPIVPYVRSNSNKKLLNTAKFTPDKV